MRRSLAASLLFALLAANAHAATFQVTRADDNLMLPCEAGNCTLRAAIVAAAITPEADLILMPAGTFTLARNPVTVSGTVTIRGAGSAATSIVGTSEDVAFVGGTLSQLTLEGVRFTTPEGAAISVTDGSLTLRDVDMPNDANQVIAEEHSLTASLDIASSRIPVAACIGDTAVCTLRDSTFIMFGVIGAQATLDAQRIVSAGVGPSTGLYVASNGRVHVTDSTFSDHAKPIEVNASDADILIERTRFFGNTGPMRGQGGGMARLDDAEFSDNLVSNANITLPAVLHATDGTAWRINRALFDGNRGGGGGNTVGAVVAADPGANVVMTNVTFFNNTYRSGVAPMNAHAIGVVSTAAKPTIMWLIHATLRRPSTLNPNTPGSLLSVTGPGSSVRLFNSALDGTCLFGNGGGVLNAEGNIESVGNTCGIAGAGNYVNVPANQLGLGTLADNGGFTWSVMPAPGSYTIGRAATTWCQLLFALDTFGLDQRRYLRPAGGIGCDIGAVQANGVPLTPEVFADGFE